MEYINHLLLKPDLMELREYQVSMGKLATQQNSLIVLPTSLGKTMIALISLADILMKFPHSKILVLAPTRPLVFQHFEIFQEFLIPSIKCCLFSSNLSPIQRTYSLNNHQLFFSTPQIIQNDLKADLYSLSGFGQIIFDETHKARKKYAYTYVAEKYLQQCTHPLILGLTASPGSDLFRINELCETLQIERIIFRQRENEDIRKYVHPIASNIHVIDVPINITQATSILDTALRRIRDYLLEKEVIPKRNYTSKFQFIQLIQDLRKIEYILDEYTDYSEEMNFNPDFPEESLNFPHLLSVFNQKLNQAPPDKSTIISRAITGIYLEHLKEILTTQDIRMFWKYLQKLDQRARDGNHQIKKFLNSKYILGVKKLLVSERKSPKIAKLINILSEEIDNDPSGKFIIFTQYREMGKDLTDELNQNPLMKAKKIQAKRFIGQASREDDQGLSQKVQAALIAEFKNEKYNVLIATSVAEEGLDIPNVTAVIFYDMVPSEIRLIQRRGRTGRHKPGICHYLINKGTLDSIYYQVSSRREDKMHDLLKNPQLVRIVSPISRTSKPIHKEQSLEEIKRNYTSRKDREIAEKNIKIEQMIEKYSFNSSTKRKNATTKYREHNPSQYVNDWTIKLTNHALTSQKKTNKQSTKKKKNQILTKWVFDWIYSTMQVLGTSINNHIYCEIDELYKAAIEENIDSIKIQKEIDNGLKKNLFQTKNSQLILIEN